MKPKVKKPKEGKIEVVRKKDLKREIYEVMDSFDHSVYSVSDDVMVVRGEVETKISKLLSEYFMNWESLKYFREEVLKYIEPKETYLSKKEMDREVLNLIKEYLNSEQFKSHFYSDPESIEVEDLEEHNN